MAIEPVFWGIDSLNRGWEEIFLVPQRDDSDFAKFLLKKVISYLWKLRRCWLIFLMIWGGCELSDKEKRPFTIFPSYSFDLAVARAFPAKQATVALPKKHAGALLSFSPDSVSCVLLLHISPPSPLVLAPILTWQPTRHKAGPPPSSRASSGKRGKRPQ